MFYFFDVLYAEMNSVAIRWVFGLGLSAILGILSFQVYWLLSNHQSKQEEVEQKINIVLYKVAESIAAYNKSVLPREKLITQQSSNYFIVNINDVIDAYLLEFYMLDEIKRIGLDLDFEYAIYDCEKDEMVYGHYCDIDSLPDLETNRTLPKYDKFDYYFGVRFPQLRNAIFGSMSMTFILSGLLFLTLIFFAVALYTIMTQKRLSDLQRDFINNMTHELKTPLASIKIAGETFLQEKQISENPRLNRYATIIRDQSGRLNQHVEKILDVARLESDLVKLKKEEFNILHLLEKIISDQATHDHSNIRLNLRGNLKYTEVFADPLHVANVFHNLIDNAIKYNRGDTRIEINLSSTNKKELLIEVRDYGVGMSKQELSKIFNKFYRVPTGDVHNTKGFGLGLYYVQQIIKLHNWAIHTSSEPGKFSSFLITIPKII